MPEPHDTFEIKRTILAVLEKTTAAFEEHPGPDRLFAFSAGQLSEEEEETVRDHLSLCRDCLDRLWLDPEDPLFRERDGVVDLETRRAWREMVAQIRELRAAKRLERERKRSRLYQFAAAACLLVAAGLGWKVGVTPSPQANLSASGTSGPTVNVGVYDVRRSSVRSGSTETVEPTEYQEGLRTTPITIPEGFGSFTLIFVLESGDYDSHELRILDSDRKELWRTRDVVVEEDRATLLLPRRDFDAGDYYVEIYCWRQGEATVWQYPIRLIYL